MYTGYLCSLWDNVFYGLQVFMDTKMQTEIVSVLIWALKQLLNPVVSLSRK